MHCRLSSCFNYIHMARKRLEHKRHRSSRKMKRLLQQEKERMEKKLERKRAKTKRFKKSLRKAESKLMRRTQELEEVRIANRQAYQDYAFVNAFVDNIASADAFEDAGDFFTDEQLAQTLRDLRAHWGEENQDSNDDGDGDED